MTIFKTSFPCLIFFLLAGCANFSQHPGDQLFGVDGIACVGNIMTLPAGLSEVTDTGLLSAAEGEFGKGKLCAGKVFEVQNPVNVYRVWDSTRPYSVFGSWWSLSYPEENRDSYRKQEDICPEWSALDRVTTCTLKIGTHIVIGPGQSVVCEHGIIPQSEVNQVYVPNDSQNNKIFVDNCNTGIEWPQQ